MSGKKLLLIFGMLCSFVLGVELPDYFDTITRHILEQDYEKAAILGSKSSNYYDDSYAQLLVQNSIIVDYEAYATNGFTDKPNAKDYSETGEEFIKSAKTYIAKIKKIKKPSDKQRYYKAMVQGMLGMCMIKRGSTLSGAMESRDSSKELEKLLKKYPNNVTLLQSVGLSQYYMATTLSWLPFAGGKPETGLKLVRKAVAINNIHSDITRQSLIWVMIDEKKYSKAIALADDVLSRYPNNTMVLRGKQRAQLLKKEYASAIETAKKLDAISRKRAPQNKADILSAGVTQVTALKALGKKKQAKEGCREYLSIPISKKELQIEWVKKHRKNLQSQLKELK